MGIYNDLLNKFIMTPTTKPNVKLPQGFELVWNNVTSRWTMVPIKNYSTIYLKRDHFVPKKTKEETLFETESSYENGKTNSKLHKAKRNKNDEFYTRLEDITDELKHYKSFFEGKIVYCPCDKAYNVGRSNFFTYFISVGKEWGIKKIIATQYNPNPGEHGIIWEYSFESNNNVVDENEIPTDFLYGNGSFDSEECKKIMKECDIVVTNPPFSLFRAFVGQIMDLGKKFLIIGNQNAITYKEAFKYIKENKMWLGYHNNATYIFESPNGNELESNREYVSSHGLDPNKYIKVPAVCWFTNLPHTKRTEELYLSGKYFEGTTKYPKYDNYDAIEVSKVSEIPSNYNGAMGVPITFLDKYNPNQFEILGLANDKRIDDPCFIKGTPYNLDEQHQKFVGMVLNGKATYARILIQRKSE